MVDFRLLGSPRCAKDVPKSPKQQVVGFCLANAVDRIHSSSSR